jgi:ubiquinone/menaquinone biosynthesis C-methylase UbiE
MIEEDKRMSKYLSIENITWITGKAEELNLKPETFKLVTIGDAFHRLDQLKILRNAYKLLTRGGYLVLAWYNAVIDGDNRWGSALAKRIEKNNISMDKAK